MRKMSVLCVAVVDVEDYHQRRHNHHRNKAKLSSAVVGMIVVAVVGTT